MRARADPPQAATATTVGAVRVERTYLGERLRFGALLECHRRAIAWLLVGGVMLMLAAGEALQPSAGSHHAGRSRILAHDQVAGLPLAAQGPVSAALGGGEAAYRVTGLRARNRAQHLDTDFSPGGVSVASGAARIRLRLTDFGYASALHPVGSTRPHATANRVLYSHGDGLREWYANGPLGLEQGFDLATRPRTGSGPLTLALALSGDLQARLKGSGVSLTGHGAALRYDGLVVWDARGLVLRSWLALERGHLLIRVADSGARYPLRIDPFVQQAELTASDGAASDEFGEVVAVSGSTIVVGARYHKVGSNAHQGAAYVFTNQGGGWAQTAELTASDGAADDAFGTWVAVSGSTIVVGAPSHQVGSNTGQGAVYVFSNQGGGWAQSAELTASNGALGDEFGNSVSVSGSTIAVGAVNRAGGGAGYVFTNTGGGWTQSAELTGSDVAAGDDFGLAVSVSGGTIAVGAEYHKVGSNAHQGAVYVFTNTGGGWAQSAELTASDGALGDTLGSSVAVSGSTIAAGATLHQVGSNVEQGAVYVFTNTGGTWAQSAELTASDGAAGEGFGNYVAVSGSTIAIGGAFHQVGSNRQQGAVYVFTNPGGGWAQTAELTASDGAARDAFGGSVALDGSTIAVGAYNHQVSSNAGQGAAYVFGSGRRSTTAVQCTGSAQPTLQCTATVSDSSGQDPREAPTGTVSFTASAGSFATSSCTPTGNALFVTCSVTYTPPPAGSSTAAVTITGSYGGDGNFDSSEGTFSLCANGQLVRLDSVSTDGPHSDGFRIGSQVVLHGCGFDTGMQLTWGAADQTPERITDSTSVSDDGTTATVTVPWGAVTGPITIKENGSVATLAGQMVDSWRNTEGLSFQNYGGFTTRRQFANAFATSVSTGRTFANGQPILLPRYEVFYSSQDNPGGFCYGFAYFAGQQAGLGSPLFAGHDPFHLDAKSMDQATIQSDWWKQFSDESQAFLRVNYQSAAQVRAALGSVSWNSPAIVSLFWRQTTTYPSGRVVTANQGHAILGFAVQNTSALTPPGDFTIYTYNSNDPYTGGEEGAGLEHASALSASNVAFDTRGTWSFPEFDLSGLPARSLNIEPISKLTGPLHLLQRVGLTGTVGGSTSVVSASGPTGAPVDLAPGTSDGVTVVPQTDSTGRSAASSNPGVRGISEILGPEGRWRETLANQSGQVAAAWYTPSLAARIQASHGQDAVEFDPTDGTLADAPATRAAPSTAGTMSLISGAAGRTERVLSVTGPVARSRATIKLTKTHATLATIKAGVFHIVLSTEGRRTAGQTFQSGPVKLTAGQKLTLTPGSWPRLQGTTVTAAFTGAGHHHTARLRNHLHAPRARVLTAKLHGKTLVVTLATGRVDLQTSAIQLTVTVRHRGRRILAKSVPFLLAKAHGHTIRIPLAKAIPAGASARITVQTRTGGITPTTATTSRTIKLHG